MITKLIKYANNAPDDWTHVTKYGIYYQQHGMSLYKYISDEIDTAHAMPVSAFDYLYSREDIERQILMQRKLEQLEKENLELRRSAKSIAKDAMNYFWMSDVCKDANTNTLAHDVIYAYLKRYGDCNG